MWMWSCWEVSSSLHWFDTSLRDTPQPPAGRALSSLGHGLTLSAVTHMYSMFSPWFSQHVFWRRRLHQVNSTVAHTLKWDSDIERVVAVLYKLEAGYWRITSYSTCYNQVEYMSPPEVGKNDVIFARKPSVHLWQTVGYKPKCGVYDLIIIIIIKSPTMTKSLLHTKKYLFYFYSIIFGNILFILCSVLEEYILKPTHGCIYLLGIIVVFLIQIPVCSKHYDVLVSFFVHL